MTGDQEDIYGRLWAALPPGWFADDDQLIAGLLWGAAYGLSFLYALLAYVKTQARIATAEGGLLDMVSADFFGAGLARDQNENDPSFRSRIMVQLFRERVTRNALRKILLDLTGQEPLIIEPARPADVFVLGRSGLGTGIIGSTSLPYQAFVVAYTPNNIGVPNYPGLGLATLPAGAYQCALGKTAALVAHADLISLNAKNVYTAVEAVRAEGVTIWVRLQNAPT